MAQHITEKQPALVAAPTTTNVLDVTQAGAQPPTAAHPALWSTRPTARGHCTLLPGEALRVTVRGAEVPQAEDLDAIQRLLR